MNWLLIVVGIHQCTNVFTTPHHEQQYLANLAHKSPLGKQFRQIIAMDIMAANPQVVRCIGGPSTKCLQSFN